MNIILINHYAGSPVYGMEYRPFYMAREWVRLGHAVTIVGAAFSHLRSSQPQISGTYTEEWIDGIRYIWIAAPAYQGNGFGRVKNMLAFIFRLYRYYKKIINDKRIDLVIASSTYPLDIYPAKFIAGKSGAKLIYEVHDLWPLSPMELGGMSKYHPFIVMMQIAENYAYRMVDKVVSMLPKAESHMSAHGLPCGRFLYIPNGIDINEWEENQEISESHQTIIDEMKVQGQFIVAYTGAHGIANALDTLLSAGKLLQDKAVQILLIGNGQEKKRLEAVVSETGIKNITFMPAVGKKYIPKILRSVDGLYIGLQKQALFRFGVSPNKMMDYMVAGKPIISAIEAGNDLVAEAACGISVPPEDPKAIAEAILQLQAMSASQRADMGKRGQEYVKKNHDYRVLAQRFIDSVGR